MFRLLRERSEPEEECECSRYGEFLDDFKHQEFLLSENECISWKKLVQL